MSAPKVIVFTYRGEIERPAKRRGRVASYRWTEGYSETSPEGNALYPWMTRAECRADAKAAGYRAVFVRVTPV
jgi:hypothetical protein